MEFRKLNSTRLKSAAYIKEENTLAIEFNNKVIYEYLSVPPNVHTGLMQSKSPGKFFETYIKNKYNFEKQQINQN